MFGGLSGPVYVHYVVLMGGSPRFHAWQSSLLFAAMFVLHLILSWSSVLSWILFVIDLGLIGFLSFRAYRDGRSFISKKSTYKC